MSFEKERRFLKSEVRAQTIDDQQFLVGYAAKYGVLSRPLGDRQPFREIIEPRCFDRSLADGSAIRMDINHSANMLLGTTKAKTLSVTSDNTGLFFRCVIPDTSYARDLRALTERGDVSECSFEFRVHKPGGDRWEYKGGETVRHLQNCDLLAVSVLTETAAYPDTEVALRSLTQWRGGWQIDYYRRRQRLLEKLCGMPAATPILNACRRKLALMELEQAFLERLR
jgi:HK97 family phage prohead protease